MKIKLKRGFEYTCKMSLGIYYLVGRTYKSYRDGTIRDEFGVDYDVLKTDKYFFIPNHLSTRINIR